MDSKSVNRRAVDISQMVVVDGRACIHATEQTGEIHVCPVEHIDHPALRTHVMWKLAIYPDLVIRAQVRVSDTDLKHWSFA